MKKRIVLFLFLCLLSLSSIVFSQQNKPQALKFDEFDDTTDTFFYFADEEITLAQRIRRFIAQIKKERGKKVYIVYYRARKTDMVNEDKIRNRADTTKWAIQVESKLKPEDIIVINGGFREKNTLEYWLAPKDVEPPTPTPTFDKSETFNCASFFVYADRFEFDKAKPASFSVSTYEYDKTAALNFKWTVSAGKIIEGQGTKTIKVDLSEAETSRVTAFVEIEGLPLPCEKVAFSTLDLDRKLHAFDTMARYNFSDLRGRLDNFLVALRNYPGALGYVIIYANRSGGTLEMERALTGVMMHFKFRRFDLSRIKIVRGGFRDDNTVDVWILPPGAQFPAPTPTVDEKFIRIPKKKPNRRRS